MIKLNIKNILTLFKTLFLTGAFIAILSSSAAAQIDPIEEFCKDAPQDSSVCIDYNNSKDPLSDGGLLGSKGLMAKVVKFLTFLTSGLAGIYFLVGAVRLVLAGSNEKSVVLAKGTIKTALIALFISVTAGTLISLIINVLN
jgi:hypothetical protein